MITTCLFSISLCIGRPTYLLSVRALFPIQKSIRSGKRVSVFRSDQFICTFPTYMGGLTITSTQRTGDYNMDINYRYDLILYWIREKIISVFCIEKHEKNRNYFFPNPILWLLLRTNRVLRLVLVTLLILQFVRPLWYTWYIINRKKGTGIVDNGWSKKLKHIFHVQFLRMSYRKKIAKSN